MKVEEIEDRLKTIEKSAGDYEIAHSLEDKLFEDFVKHLCHRKDYIGTQAKLVMKSKSIKFARYCA